MAMSACIIQVMIDLENELSSHISIKKNEDATFEADLYLPMELSYFKGHFPQNPILPAVGIIDISLLILKKATGRKDERIEGITSMKVRAPMMPHEKYQVDLRKVQENRWNFQWRRIEVSTDHLESVSGELEVVVPAQ